MDFSSCVHNFFSSSSALEYNVVHVHWELCIRVCRFFLESRRKHQIFFCCDSDVVSPTMLMMLEKKESDLTIWIPTKYILCEIEFFTHICNFPCHPPYLLCACFQANDIEKKKPKITWESLPSSFCATFIFYSSCRPRWWPDKTF